MTLVLTFVVVLLVNCAISLECPPGVPGDTCTSSDENQNGNAWETTTTPPDISTHTPESAPKPKSLNMMAEHEEEEVLSQHLTTTVATPSSTTQESQTMKPSNSTEEPKGRAINFSLSDHNHENGLMNNLSKTATEDLSDVSMDDDDMEDMDAKVIAKTAKNTTSGVSCTMNGLTYKNGEKVENGCDSNCTCSNGKMECTDRCITPYVKKGRKLEDSLCSHKDADDPCCSILVCEAKSAASLETCMYKNQTYKKGDKVETDCDTTCTCESGEMLCKPRCSPINKSSDRCVEVPDPADSCCKKLLCDVTLDDHEPERQEETKLKLLTAKYVNSSSIKLEFESKVDSNLEVEGSTNKSTWQTYKVSHGGYIQSTQHLNYVKLKNGDDIIVVYNDTQQNKEEMCEYKGKQLSLNEKYNDNCTSLCLCTETGVQCFEIDCPTYFGVDVLNPSCVEWETEPPNFVPSPPDCCPKSIACKNNGSCFYEEVLYNNWQQIPLNVTGCDKRCYCEMGNVECQNICPGVPALPPPDLECHRQAVLKHLPHDDCCRTWACDDSGEGVFQSKTKDIKETDVKDTNTSFETPFVFPMKAPSKVLGPLLIYTNKEADNKTGSEVESELEILPNVTLDENHYYMHKGGNKSKDAGFYQDLNGSVQKKPMHNKKFEKPFLGPVLPTLPPSKETQLPSTVNINTDNDHEHPQFPVMPSPANKHPDMISNTPHVQFHGKGDPDELLQFINQHPELANYPPGSVFEIHTFQNQPQKPGIPQHPNLPNNNLPNNNRPYVIHQDELSPNINVEHLLQHIQKNNQPFIPFPVNPQVPHQNGPLLITSPNGLIIPNRSQNLTRPGINDQLYPGGFINLPPGYQQPQEDINVHTLVAIDAHTIRLAFTIPPVIVGLHGRVEVRYTSNDNNDPNTWQQQIFAPPNDLIETSQLEFDLLSLKEDTEYKIKITVILRDLHNTPTSRIYTVRTPKEAPMTTLPPMIPIEPNLIVTDINATWVNVAWRKFTDNELQFIDGVQLRYKEIDGKIYAATPLIHRAVTSYTLENLKPNTKYEAGIFFIPFPGQTTELHAEHMIHFTTANEFDNYGFNVTLEISQIKATNVEIAWSGVPYPEDKYVNIYRAIYQSDSGKGDFSTFKIAKRDSPSKTIIQDLKPGVRYRLWLEVYLTNGRIKTSNVQDFITKPRPPPTLDASSLQGKLEAGDLTERKGDYYGPLVIVAILAAIAILSTLILLLILVKRHNQNKAAITPPPRVSQSAYDNPTYKVEIQQETMDL